MSFSHSAHCTFRRAEETIEDVTAQLDSQRKRSQRSAERVAELEQENSELHTKVSLMSKKVHAAEGREHELEDSLAEKEDELRR